jgi:hypothetical protein
MKAGVNVKIGLSFTGSTAASYCKVPVILCGMWRIGSACCNRYRMNRRVILLLPVSCVYALKSAAASIGADTVSKQALELETAGKQNDTVVLENKLPLFR